MSIKRITAITLGGVALVCTIVFGIVPHVAKADITYTGQEVFLTQDSYEQFKLDVKTRVYNDSLVLEGFDVLASEPPIIVNFKVTVPYEYQFPYGSVGLQRSAQIVAAVLLSILTGMLFIGLPVGTSS